MLLSFNETISQCDANFVELSDVRPLMQSTARAGVDEVVKWGGYRWEGTPLVAEHCAWRRAWGGQMRGYCWEGNASGCRALRVHEEVKWGGIAEKATPLAAEHCAWRREWGGQMREYRWEGKRLWLQSTALGGVHEVVKWGGIAEKATPLVAEHWAWRRAWGGQMRGYRWEGNASGCRALRVAACMRWSNEEVLLRRQRLWFHTCRMSGKEQNSCQ